MNKRGTTQTRANPSASLARARFGKYRSASLKSRSECVPFGIGRPNSSARGVGRCARVATSAGSGKGRFAALPANRIHRNCGGVIANNDDNNRPGKSGCVANVNTDNAFILDLRLAASDFGNTQETKIPREWRLTPLVPVKSARYTGYLDDHERELGNVFP